MRGSTRRQPRLPRRLPRRPRRPPGIRRRLRGLVPGPLRRADLEAFRVVARTDLRGIGPALPHLSRAANQSGLWVAIAAAMWAWGGRPGRRAAVQGLVSVAVTSVVTNLPAKLLTARTRPELAVVPEIRRLAEVPTSTSFPSGHAASAFAFATAAGLSMPGFRVPLFGLAAAVGFSRVYTGVHYPADVLAGAAIGTTLARAARRRWAPDDAKPAVTTSSLPRVAAPDGRGLIVVANMQAGNRLAPKPARWLRQLLPDAEILEAEPDEDFVSALRRAAARARVIGVAGGDGSASTAAAIAMEAGIPLAVFPAGTLNHLATDLGVERMEDAARAVSEGRVVAMDVGELDGEPFLNAAHLGTYPRLIRLRQQVEGTIGKWPAAALSVLWEILVGQPLTLRIDGRTRRVWALFLGNGEFVGDGVAPTRRARLDAGRIDVRLVHAESPMARLRLSVALLVGRPERSGAYEHWTTEALDVDAGADIEVARDGEVLSCPVPTTVRIRRRAVILCQAADR